MQAPSTPLSHRLREPFLRRRAASGDVLDHNGKAAPQAALPLEETARPRWILPTVAAMVLSIVGLIVAAEMQTSWVQSLVLSRVAYDAAYRVEDGASENIHFPAAGPHNERLGYTRLFPMTEALQTGAFRIDSQAEISGRHRTLLEWGLFPIYEEKNQAGLLITDSDGQALFEARYPARVYSDFEAIPPVIWKTLLYIENRELLDERYPRLNPAVEWDRFVQALFLQVLERVGVAGSGPGASTLATQLEKFRYSPEGLTGSAREKLRQMAAASVRAYMDGPNTLESRRRIVKDYLNSLPLGGRRGYGEVTGLAEGLAVWYAADFDAINQSLWSLSRNGSVDGQTASQYRQVLSLLLATRRPSYLLATDGGRLDLAATTDLFLTLLARDAVIPIELASGARDAAIDVADSLSSAPSVSFIGRKAATAVRVELMDLLDVSRVYDLDHYDLSVSTTYSGPVQKAVTAALASLGEREAVRSMGMEGFRLIGGQDPSRVHYAVTLYEAADDGNRLVVQTDNFQGPFNINAGSKLELGSTAKLRTLVSYLQTVEQLYIQHLEREAGGGGQAPATHRSDRITTWVRDYMQRRPNATLPELLDAAMNRTYSASTGEQFYTGGGVHVFHNFSASDGGTVHTVRTGFRHSVNLVFIRMMRDIVSYHAARLPGDPQAMLEDAGDPRRETYLRRFADQEGREFLWKFRGRYRGKSVDDAWRTFVAEHRPSAQRFGWAVRSVVPGITADEFARVLNVHGFAQTAEQAAALYEKVDPEPFGWHDRGYLARVHPLELWYLSHYFVEPQATWTDVVRASELERQEAYRWLFTSTSMSGQNNRIRTLIEREAFVELHKQWAAAGYPFETLVPSFATAIGSSADRPTALAQLVGIIMRDGMKYPEVRIDRLHFAAGTPYETVMSHAATEPVRVLSEEVAAALKGALVDVVENGTAIRIRGGIKHADGSVAVVGGKTGTGDNRLNMYGSGGRLIGSEIRSRTSTFVFFIDDRLFGTVTAYVEGQESARHRFTSSLPVQLLKALGPELAPLLNVPADGAGERPTVARTGDLGNLPTVQ